jgi:hypothetical protein
MRAELIYRLLGVSALVVALAPTPGCEPRSSETSPSAQRSPQVQGAPIAALSSSNGAASGTNFPFVPADYSKPDPIENGLIRLGWDKLSGFKYEIYEYYPEGHAGRPLLKSDDVIPAGMKSYDGKRVLLSGFMLPLRTSKGRVTEFLFLRDQGTCCFGARAQINHFIRVKYTPGIQVEDNVLWQVTGPLRVGEIHVQGYLTGIYQLEADSVRPLKN